MRAIWGEFCVGPRPESAGLQTFWARKTSLSVTAMTTATFHPIPDTGGLNALASATAAAVEVNPTAAVLVVSAEAQPLGAVGSEITVGTRRVHVDEPAALGGGGEAPNPVEYYLSALLSCQIVTYRFWAQRLGIEVSSLSASAEGDLDVHGFFGLDPTVRPGFQEIRVTVDIEGPATEAQYRELQRLVDEHCPVLDLTVSPTPVHTTLNVA